MVKFTETLVVVLDEVGLPFKVRFCTCAIPNDRFGLCDVFADVTVVIPDSTVIEGLSTK